MKLFGFEITRAPQTKTPSRTPWQLRPNDGQGVYTSQFSYIPRKVTAEFYEYLREAIPIIDAAIGRLNNLDGFIVCKGNNDTLVSEIQDWIKHVPVNDIQTGVQAFHQGFSNEALEQGFAIGEFISNKSRNDINGLKVADSKFIRFKRTDTGINMYQKGNNDFDYRLLNPNNLLYFSINNENQNPYGTPLMRACEFVAKILVTIQNATLNVWERFGDPSFEIIYKTSKRDAGTLEQRRKMLEDEFSAAIRNKRQGYSADFIRAIDTSSDITIKVIGADGQILEMETPARHVLEQIVAKTGLAPWMLGLHWSTTERLSDAEVGIIMADVRTRQAAKLPVFEKLVKNLLLLRGRTWKTGDWFLEFEQVNLLDIVKQAQARFLHAQADMYYLQNAAAAGIEITVNDLYIGRKQAVTQQAHKDTCTCKACGQKEQRPLPWPEIDRLEAEYEADLKRNWSDLQIRITEILKLSEVKTVKQDPPTGIPTPEQFTFSEEQKSAILTALNGFIGIYSWKESDSVIRWFYGQAYSFGLLKAVELIGKDRPILDIIQNSQILEEMYKSGFELVKNRATINILNKLLPSIEAQVIAGANPTHVARTLRKLFENANADWERLARSEMGMAAEKAKLDEWKKWKIEKVELLPAPDACAICLALAGIYEINKAPIIVTDTHPRCRCTLIPA